MVLFVEKAGIRHRFSFEQAVRLISTKLITINAFFILLKF